jgi:hypothetical protein
VAGAVGGGPPGPLGPDRKGTGFALVVCRTAVIPPKPDPTSYLEACYRLGANPAWSVAVEDLPASDALAASLEDICLAEALMRARTGSVSRPWSGSIPQLLYRRTPRSRDGPSSLFCHRRHKPERGRRWHIGGECQFEYARRTPERRPGPPRGGAP